MGRTTFTTNYLENARKRFRLTKKEDLASRAKMAKCLIKMGDVLKLNQRCTQTSIVFAHRFYLACSYKVVDEHMLLIAIVFLAVKVEDEYRSFPEILKAAANLFKFKVPPEAYEEKKADVFMMEMFLVRQMGYQLHVKHPFEFIEEMKKTFTNNSQVFEMASDIATTSWIETTICLLHPPEVIAVYAVNLASNYLSEILINDGLSWIEYLASKFSYSTIQAAFDDCHLMDVKKFMPQDSCRNPVFTPPQNMPYMMSAASPIMVLPQPAIAPLPYYSSVFQNVTGAVSQYPMVQPAMNPAYSYPTVQEQPQCRPPISEDEIKQVSTSSYMPVIAGHTVSQFSPFLNPSPMIPAGMMPSDALAAPPPAHQLTSIVHTPIVTQKVPRTGRLEETRKRKQPK